MDVKQKTVLITPLDWGLGHATRCMPIIRHVLSRNMRVILASNSRAYDLLAREFPDLLLLRLPKYDMRYYAENMVFNFLLQTPRIFWSIYQEYRAVQKIVRDHKVDMIISDNRFGCFSRQARSIFVTHQLYPISPIGIFSRPFHGFNAWLISFFDACWIPDYEGSNNLSGILCHPPLKMPTTYLGVLSRMERRDAIFKYDALFLLSGPEPQRTRLERLLRKQIPALPGRYLMVQGKTEAYEESTLSSNCKIISFLTSDQLNAVMAASKLVVCRSGYSTLMDLVKMGKPALLIPTPGQTEQEYLAEYLDEQGIFPYQTQQAISLADGLEKAASYAGPAALPFDAGQDDLADVLDRMLRHSGVPQ
jgi:UDP:flavonoid glycosyltransferase YjiC (YdhE family)